jgi:carbon-monoxide dehydrogenase medium subunit
MYPAAFKYAAPTSIEDAIALLQQGGGDAKILAGGHSLLPLMKLRLSSPGVLVDINRIAGLRFIEEDDGLRRLRIGALARHVDFERSALVRAKYPLLHDAAGGIGDPQVRNRGTMAGSLAHGDPASDWPAVLLAAGGEVVARGPGGERVIAASDFVVDTFATALNLDELVTEVRVPLPLVRGGGAYVKLERKVGDYATVGVAVQLALGEQGEISSIGIGLCNVGPTSIKATAAEDFLRGKPAAPVNINEAARLAAEASDPIADDRGPVEYKRAMVKEITRRALQRALGRALGGGQ